MANRPVATFGASVKIDDSSLDATSKRLKTLQAQLIELEKGAVRVANTAAGKSPTAKSRFTSFDQVLSDDQTRAKGGMTPLAAKSPELAAFTEAIKALTAHIAITRRSGAEPSHDPGDFQSPSQRAQSANDASRRALKAQEDSAKAAQRTADLAKKKAEDDAQRQLAQNSRDQKQQAAAQTKAQRLAAYGDAGSDDPALRRRAYDVARQRAAERRRWATEGSVPPGQPLSMAERLSSSVLNARSLSMLGSLATGNAGPLAGSALWSLLGSPGNAKRSGTGLLGRLTGTAATVATDATDATPSLAAGGASMVPVIGAAVGAFLVTAAGAEFLRQGQTQARKYQLGLSTTIGGLSSTNPGAQLQGILSDIVNVGKGYSLDPNVAINTANQLSASGIEGKGTGPNSLHSALNTTLAFATRANMNPLDVAKVTSTLMVQGGQSADTVSRMFQVLEKQATKTNIPIEKMIASFTSLETLTNGINVSLTGVYGIAAAQGKFGQAVNVGQMVSPLAGATGVPARVAAAVLGIPLDTFIKAQQDPGGALLDYAAKYAQHMPGAAGKNTPTAVLETAISVLPALGLADFTGMSDPVALAAVKKYFTATPHSFAKAAQTLRASKAMALEYPGDYNSRIRSLATQITPDTAAAGNWVKDQLLLAANATTQISDLIAKNSKAPNYRGLDYSGRALPPDILASLLTGNFKGTALGAAGNALGTQVTKDIQPLKNWLSGHSSSIPLHFLPTTTPNDTARNPDAVNTNNLLAVTPGMGGASLNTVVTAAVKAAASGAASGANSSASAIPVDVNVSGTIKVDARTGQGSMTIKTPPGKSSHANVRNRAEAIAF